MSIGVMSSENLKPVISSKEETRAASENLYNKWKLDDRKAKSDIILSIAKLLKCYGIS